MNDLFDYKTLLRLKEYAMKGEQKEVIREFSVSDDGELKLIKQKETKKNILPDVDILKFVYMVSKDTNISSYTDEELKREKERLINELKEKLNDDREC